MSLLMENSVAKIGCGDPGDPIEFGALFNGGHLSFTPVVSGDDNTWSVSFWEKRIRSVSGSVLDHVFCYGSSAPGIMRLYYYNDRLSLVDSESNEGARNTEALSRDYTGHRHVYIEFGNGIAVASGRMRLWIGGREVTSFNLDTAFLLNKALRVMQAGQVQRIGSNGSDTGRFILSEFIHRDGIIGTGPTPFGRFNTDGVWVPKLYLGNCGPSGFRLDFSDAANIGRDVSPRNIAPHSESLSDLAYDKVRVSIVPDAIIGPGGDMADQIVADAGQSYCYPSLQLSVDAGEQYVITWRVRPEEISNIELSADFPGVSFFSVLFGLNELTASQSVSGSEVPFDSVAIEPDEEGFVCCSARVTAPSSIMFVRLYLSDGISWGRVWTGGESLYATKLHVREAARDFGYVKTDDFSRGGNDFDVVGDVQQITDTPSSTPAVISPNSPNAGSLSNGNRDFVGTSTYHMTPLTFFARSGKLWLEFEASGPGPIIGVCPSFGMPGPGSNLKGAFGYYGNTPSSGGGGLYTGSVVSVQTGGVAYADGNIVNVGLDLDNMQAHFFCDNVLQYTQDLDDGLWGFFVGDYISTGTPSVRVINDPNDMTNPPPEGYVTPSSANAKCPAITDPSQYVQAPITIGGGAVTSLWNCIANKTLVFSKRRDIASNWRLNVVIGGVQYTVATHIDGTQIFDADGLTFTTSGFALGSDTEYQGTCEHFVRRASPLAGIDFLLIDNHVSGQVSTIAHNCGGSIHRAWDIPLDGGDIRQFHHKMPAGDFTKVNVAGRGSDPDWFSSTVNTVSLGGVVASGRHLLILERGVEQFSSFDVYDGNGIEDGPMIPADFAPLWFDVVRGDASGIPTIRSMRAGEVNPVVNELRFDGGEVQNTISDKFYLLSNGAKCATYHATAGQYTNLNGGKYYTGMYALHPGKFANAR